MNQQTLPDPSDWQGTQLAPLESLDSFLHCQICKDFFNSAVITTCSHTFCSLCIRRCLAAEGRCPSCRGSEQESRLRKNTTIQEVTDAFVAARSGILDFARRESQKAHYEELNRLFNQERNGITDTRGSKRKRGSYGDIDNLQSVPAEPRTRSQKKAASLRSTPSSTSHIPQHDGAIVIDSDQDDEEYLPDAAAQNKSNRRSPPSQADDGLVACPICAKRMKEELVFPHTDICTGAPSPQPQQRSKRASHSAQTLPITQQPRSQNTKPAPERLPQITHSLFRDQALRKKLSELGIPSWGSRQLLIKRHSEWLALWNANCDSTRPRSRAALMSDLDRWERTQGGYASQGGGSVLGSSASGGTGTAFTAASVMQKGFDGHEWAQNHRDDFKDLIAKAKEKRNARATTEAEENASNDKRPIAAEAKDGGDETGPSPRSTTDLNIDEAPQYGTADSSNRMKFAEADRYSNIAEDSGAVGQPVHLSPPENLDGEEAMDSQEAQSNAGHTESSTAANGSMASQIRGISTGPVPPEAVREDKQANEARTSKQPMFATPS